MGKTRSALIKIAVASLASAAAVLLLLDLALTAAGPNKCDSSIPAPPAGATQLDSAFRELISLGWLNSGDRAVFVGPDAVSAAVIARQLGLPPGKAVRATECCSLPFGEESFDFAFSAALDRARVPARVVLEMERVLRPGRVGAIIRIRPGSGIGRTEGLMRAAAPVASLLRFSDVIGARAVNGSAMVVFRKHRQGKGGGGREIFQCKGRIAIVPLIYGDIIKLASALGI